LSEQLKAVIAMLLEKEPDARMTAEELVGNEWLLEQREDWEALAELLATDD
jgi:hypothetical protein